MMKPSTDFGSPVASRRRILGGAVFVGSATATWVKPVVSSVLLPAHADTTMAPTPVATTTEPATPTLSPEEVIDNIIRPILLKNPH